jgi:murein DD-endopeptidase MepM/ murein hydrolase activator NlpD
MSIGKNAAGTDPGVSRRGFLSGAVLTALGLTAFDLARLSSSASAAPIWGYPLKSYSGVSTIFNPNQTVTTNVRAHDGIDFDNRYVGSRGGDPIYAIANGVIAFSGWSGGYGNLVIVRHWDGWESRYAHTPSGSPLAVGTPVYRGTVIATIGTTGNSTGPHLHLETMLDGRLQDPWPLVRDAPLPTQNPVVPRSLMEADMSVQLWLYTPTNTLLLVDHMNMTIRNLGNTNTFERDHFASGAFAYRTIGEPTWTNNFKNFRYITAPNVTGQPA